jgi:hypothetical protein
MRGLSEPQERCRCGGEKHELKSLTGLEFSISITILKVSV